MYLKQTEKCDGWCLTVTDIDIVMNDLISLYFILNYYAPGIW